MDKIDKLLDYIHVTNPGMTKEGLINKLLDNNSSARSLILIYDENTRNNSTGKPKPMF